MKWFEKYTGRIAAWAVVFMLILPACNNRQMGSFTEKELSWLVYDSTDTLTFIDSQGANHQLLVNYRDDFTQVRNYYPIEAEIEIYNPDDEERFRIYLLKDEKDFKKFFRLAKVYRSFALTEPVESLTINGKAYHDVYVFREDSAAIDSDVWRVYFNTDHGILRYDKRDGASYELVPRKEPV